MADDTYKYRFTTVRGLERRKYYSSVWENVTGGVLECMTADELRQCADAMDAPQPTRKEEG